MFRFLLILFLILYVIYKIGSLFFRAGAASQQYRRNSDGNDNRQQKPKSKGKNFKGGEYIDYEEIK
jgi:hypothetical protein